MIDPIPDYNLFMMCPTLDRAALREMPAGFALRTCRPEELDLWKAIHFDDEETARANHDYMTGFFDRVYAPRGDLFYRTCLFVCDGDRPIGTCFAWQAYGSVTTVHWFKVLPAYEGRGIGRALLSHVMQGIQSQDYPVFLHTQPASFRAIKLYADFGFRLLADPIIGTRSNDLMRSLPILRHRMPAADYGRLRILPATPDFLQAVGLSTQVEC